MNGKYGRFLIAALFAMSFLSCGIPSYTIAESPVLTNSSDTSIFSFQAPADDTNILGYKIYYKIYPADSTEIASDKAVITSTDNVLFGSTLINELSGLGFQNLYIGSPADDPPQSLISVDDLTPGEELAINFATDEGDVTVSGASSIGYPLRTVKDTSTGEYKKFSNNVVSSDDDSNGVEDTNQYSVSFVAFSYVSSIITSCEHSVPVFLGTLIP